MSFKTIYICQNCNTQSPKWLGKCPECEAWSSFVEDVISTETAKKTRQQRNLNVSKATPLHQVSKDFYRLSTGLNEVDRVLGGGLVPGSLVLLGGEPGIGKSTLTLQLCEKLTQKQQKILYVSGEESIQQIALRAERLNIASEHLVLVNENRLEAILKNFGDEKPTIGIIDSIQVMSTKEASGLQGGINQVRACTEQLMEFAKHSNTTLLIIGHVNKGGNLAGPKTLEHLVDTVLYLEGDRYHDLRLLRGVKNRFGATNEVGLFEMAAEGLKEVPDPSKLFLNNRPKSTIGTCLTVALEGSRPLLVEIQALTHRTNFGYPKRTASGFDLNRLDLLIAVLQRHGGIDLGQHDVYVNVVGGLKLKDPGVDLAVCMAILSSHEKKPIESDSVAFGEIGLAGEIRRVSQEEKRLQEINRLNLKNLVEVKTLTEMVGSIKLTK